MKDDQMNEDKIVEALRALNPKEKRSARSMAEEALQKKQSTKTPVFVFAGALFAACLVFFLLPALETNQAMARGTSANDFPRVVWFSGDSPTALHENQKPHLGDFVSAEVVFSSSNESVKNFALYFMQDEKLIAFSACVAAPQNPQSLRLKKAFRFEQGPANLVLALFAKECSTSEATRALSMQVRGVKVQHLNLSPRGDSQ